MIGKTQSPIHFNSNSIDKIKSYTNPKHMTHYGVESERALIERPTKLVSFNSVLKTFQSTS